MSDSDWYDPNSIYGGGYGMVAKRVLKDKDLTITAKAIYAYIASYAGKKGKAYPSVGLICGDLGMTKSTFYKHIKHLTGKGYVTVHKQRNEGQRFDSNLYVIEHFPCPKIQDTVESGTEPSDTNSTILNSNSLNSIENNMGKNISQVAEHSPSYTHDLLTYINTQDIPEIVWETVKYYTVLYDSYFDRKHPRIDQEQVDKVTGAIYEHLGGFEAEDLRSLIDSYFENEKSDRNINHFATVLPRYVENFYN